MINHDLNYKNGFNSGWHDCLDNQIECLVSKELLSLDSNNSKNIIIELLQQPEINISLIESQEMALKDFSPKECFDMGYEKGKEFATVSTLKLLNNKGIRIPKKLQSNFVVISETFLLY